MGFNKILLILILTVELISYTIIATFYHHSLIQDARTMPTFEPTVFIPSSSKAKALSSAVTEIWAVGHSIDAAKEEGNHWCFYLQLPDGTSSVRSDITPSSMVPSTTIKGGSKANMIISLLNHNSSKSSQIISKLQVQENLLVKEVVNTLIDAGVHRYEFNEKGTGCRAWVSAQLDLLFSKGVITSSEEVAEARKALTTQAPKGYTYEMDSGGYY